MLNRVIAVPATRTIRGIDTEVEVGPDDGMPVACVLSLDNVMAVKREFFVEPICRLNHRRMQEVCRALRLATGCA